MKYYIDCEFLEGTQKEKFPISLFRKETKPTIDLISIAIVEEDRDAFSKRNGLSDKTYGGREYYAISKDFNLEEAWNRYELKKEYPDNTEEGAVSRKVYWIRENVLRPIWDEKCKEGFSFKNSPMTPYGVETLFTYSNFKKLLNKYGKTNKQIAEEIKEFISQKGIVDKTAVDRYGAKKTGTTPYERRMDRVEYNFGFPEFYGYYCDYDWVVFCQLFGKMIDLPKGFPMYCFDLKQELDRKANSYDDHFMSGKENFETKLSYIKNKSNYPKQTNEHNALLDARFNKQLHQFLNEL
jgi:hypothetical protein